MLQIPSQLVGANPLADGSMSLRFHTQELTTKEKLIILEHFQKAGWLLFKEDSFIDDDLPKESSGYEEGKTPAQRLRAVIFKYWQQHKQNEEAIFENFYRKAIEKQITAYKEKLV